MTPDKAAVTDLFARHVSSGKVTFFQQVGIEFVMGRREGPYIWDIDGRTRLINCHCNGGVFNLGHRHPAVVQALVESVQMLDIGNHHLISEPRARLAARLAELAPGLSYTVFAVGGGEATDLAIKVARGYTGRQKIVSASGGYHGHTGFALFTGDEKYNVDRFRSTHPLKRSTRTRKVRSVATGRNVAPVEHGVVHRLLTIGAINQRELSVGKLFTRGAFLHKVP